MTSSDSAIPMNSASTAHASDRLSEVRPDADTKLMLAFQRGESAAFEQLVERNQARVYSLLYRYLSGSSECEDLTQEVFLRVFKGAGRYVPTAKFSTWLYRITANVAFNRIRAQARGRPVRLEVEGDDADGGYPRAIEDVRQGVPDGAMSRRELAEQVAAALERLPESQRMAIVLNKYEGMCYDEIARVLDCTTMAVKSLLSRARANLRSRLVRYVTHGELPGETDRKKGCHNRPSDRNLSLTAGLDRTGGRTRSATS